MNQQPTIIINPDDIPQSAIEELQGNKGEEESENG